MSHRRWIWQVDCRERRRRWFFIRHDLKRLWRLIFAQRI